MMMLMIMRNFIERRKNMTLYKVSKEDKKKGLKKLSSMNETSKKYNDSKKEFKSKHDYYITLQELASAVKYGNAKNEKGLYNITAQLIRIKKNNTSKVETHKDIQAKYIACVVNPSMEFAKLEKRGFKIKERDDGKVVYFIPLNFVCTLLPNNKYSCTENITMDLFDIEIFKYTGPIDMLKSLSIFNISSEVYLTGKASVDDQTINVIV